MLLPNLSSSTLFSQAPDLYSVLSNRLVRSLFFDETTSIQNAQLAATHALRTSLGAAREAAPAYDTRSSAIRWLPSQPKEDPAEATEISIQGDAMMARALEGQARRKALKSMAPSGAPAQVGTVRGTPAAGTPAAGGDRGTPGRL